MRFIVSLIIQYFLFHYLRHSTIFGQEEAQNMNHSAP